MIVLHNDTRNITVVSDLLNAKMLVSVLRNMDPLVFVKASEDLNKDGFKHITVSHIAVACGQFSDVLARTTDRMKYQLVAEQPEQLSTELPPVTIQ